MGSVFHYTDAAGALGILNSQSLFATDSRYLNDSAEGTIIDGLLAPLFLSEVAAVTKKLVDEGLVSQAYYQQLGSRADGLQVEALFRSIKTAATRISPIYVLSFCRHDNGSEPYKHGLLSQWRGYADRGGIAIEFDEDGLNKLIQSECEKFFYGPVQVRDVLYSEFTQLFNEEDYSGLASAMIGQIFLDRKVTPIFDFKKRRKIRQICGDADIDRAMARYLSVAPFLKHSGFAEEREYRLAVACVQQNRLPSEAQLPAKPIEFRTKNNLLVPYVRMFDGSTLPIKSIIVGPHANQELQKESVERLLQLKGLSSEVRLSEIPFRGF